MVDYIWHLCEEQWCEKWVWRQFWRRRWIRLPLEAWGGLCEPLPLYKGESIMRRGGRGGVTMRKKVTMVMLVMWPPSSNQMDQSYKWRQWSSRWMTMVTTLTMVTMIKRRWISRFCRQCWSPRTSPERWQLCHHCWLWQNLMTNFNDEYCDKWWWWYCDDIMNQNIIIQGDFFTDSKFQVQKS